MKDKITNNEYNTVTEFKVRIVISANRELELCIYCFSFESITILKFVQLKCFFLTLACNVF